MKSNSVSKRSGILAGGNWIIDRVKMVDAYPGLEQLANIKSQHMGTGGSPYNVLLDLAKLGVEFPLMGAGLVGKDTLGAAILEDCAKHKIDTRHLKATAEADTSYTDVFTVQSNGKRTFFHYRGANALWDGKDLDFSKIKARIFHLGYLLLLDKLDGVSKDGTTPAAKLLRSQVGDLARALGFAPGDRASILGNGTAAEEGTPPDPTAPVTFTMKRWL